MPTSIVVSSYSYLQVQVWNRPAGAPVEPDALFNVLYEIGTPEQGQSSQHLGISLELGEAPAPGWDEGRQLYTTYRLVNATVTNGVIDAITSSSDWLSSGFALSPTPLDEENTAYRALFLDNPHVVDERDVTDFSGNGPGVQGITLGVGGDIGRVSDLVGIPRPGSLDLSGNVGLPAEVFFYDPTGF